MPKLSEKQLLLSTIAGSLVFVAGFCALIWWDLDRIHTAEVTDENPEAAEITEQELWGERRWIQELETQTAILSRSIRLRIALAREYLAAGREKDAIRTLEEALGVTVFDMNVQRPLVLLYRKVGERKKAIRSARVVVALITEQVPEDEAANMWLDLTEVLLDDGQVEEAKSAFGEAKKLADEQDVPRIKTVGERFGQ